MSEADDAGTAKNARPSATFEHAGTAAWLVALRYAPLALGAVHLALFTWVVVQRFRFPVELEWMSGGVADHVERVLLGKPLYVAPSAEFIPYLYPPLHYWLSALLAKAMPIATACRVVSIAATGATGAFVFRATKRLGGSTYWALVATSLYVGAYSVTGYWYDLDRSDSLLTAMLTGGFVVALESEGVLGVAIAGALFGGAFLAKQPATIFFGAAVAAFVLARRLQLAVALLGGGLAVLVPAALLLSARSDGWFWFYCVKMPASHGIKMELFTVFFVIDASKTFLLFGATCAVLGRFGVQVWRGLRASDPPSKGDALLGAMVLAGLFTSATSRLHVGGYINVLMFMTTFAAIGFGVAASRATKLRLPAVEALLAAAALMQLLHFLYDPEEAAPNEGRVRDAKIVEARVRELEREGEVVIHGRAHLTEQRHFHIMALMDVLRGGLPIPEDLARGIRERRYAAYVVDEFGELGLEPVLGYRSELFELVTRNYFIAQRLDDREPPPVVGWIAHPSWVMRPRKAPLADLKIEELKRRQQIEMGIAEMRMRAVQAGVREVDLGDEVEALAAAADRPRSLSVD